MIELRKQNFFIFNRDSVKSHIIDHGKFEKL